MSKSSKLLKIFAFDLDGTIITQPPKWNSEVDNTGAYLRGEPYRDVVESINKLYDEGNTIIIFTARGCRSGIDYTELTKNQLEKIGVKYHELILGKKPHFDYLIDDKAINIKTWRRKIKMEYYMEACTNFLKQVWSVLKTAFEWVKAQVLKLVG